jgi:hypothetical protein
MRTSATRLDRGQRLREELHNTLQGHARELIAGLVATCAGDRAAHIVDAFLDATLEGRPENFISHVQHLDAARGAADTGVRDLWVGLTLLEARIWRIVVREMPLIHQVMVLSWVTQTIGMAKDRLAQGLMVQLERCRDRRNVLEETLCLLSGGTDPAPRGRRAREVAAAGIG